MFKKYLKEKKDIVEKALEREFSKFSYPKVIAEGMQYSVMNGGKRLRPILLLMVLDLYGKDEREYLQIASALEFIHSYSLVHDDLPALDNDEYRRGKLTTHKKYGEAEGILIGDALLTHAFALLTSKKESIEAEKIVEIVNKTSIYSGINGMIGGQMVDIESEHKKVDENILKYIHKNKTGKLIKLPIEIGAILCDANSEEYKALERYAEEIGLAFQIKDDILDIEGDFEKLGKKIGSDLALEKTTYPSLYGMEKSKQLLSESIGRAKKALEIFETKNIEMFLDLADYISNRES